MITGEYDEDDIIDEELSDAKYYYHICYAGYVDGNFVFDLNLNFEKNDPEIINKIKNNEIKEQDIVDFLYHKGIDELVDYINEDLPENCMGQYLKDYLCNEITYDQWINIFTKELNKKYDDKKIIQDILNNIHKTDSLQEMCNIYMKYK